MIISIHNARICYDEILKKLQKHKGKILIFVAIDIDSITALRILVSLLKTDNLRYEIIPVMNNDILQTKIEDNKPQTTEANEIRAIILLNCGGTTDVSKNWFCEEIYDIITLVVDSHRPTHHNNINEAKSVVLINDKMYNMENCPKDEDFKEMESEDDLDEEVDEEEEEQDEWCEQTEEIINLKKEPNTKGRKLKKKKDDLEDIEGESECLDKDRTEQEGENAEDILTKIQPGKTKRSTVKDEKIAKRERKKKKRTMIQKYYSGSYFGFPATYVLYRIACQLHREDNHTIWYLITAMTEHYLQSHYSAQIYDHLYSECHNEVLRLSQIKKPYKKGIKTEDFNDKPLIEGKWDDVKVKTTNYDSKTIIIEPDYQLYLYRHWNLFDSFVNSAYTLGKLRTWKEPGKFEVQKLFAYIGVPLDEAKQKYTFMKNDHKILFKNRILEISKKFDLSNIVFNSFLFQFDQITQLSASDFCYLTAAMLDYPFNLSDLGIGIDTLPNLPTEEEKENAQATKDVNKYDNFWAAYSFLSLKDTSLIKKLIDLAIKLQLAIVRNGTEIIDKRAFTANQTLRYTLINSDISDESKYFHQPMSLKRLALFTIDTIYRSSYKALDQKPYMLAMLNTKDDSYLVAGIHGKGKSFNDERNQFSIKFKLAANKIGAKLMLNSFDDCIVQIKKDDFAAFLEEVCNI